MNEESFAKPRDGLPAAADLREQLAKLLAAREETIINDSVAVFPFSSAQPLDAAVCERLGHLLLELLGAAIRAGSIDPRSGLVADLRRLTSQRGVPVDQLYAFTYLTERTALDELALDEGVGATTEPWPLVAQLVRRASFELLAAYAERLQLEPSEAAIMDRLTTLHTRPVFEAALDKEMQRAERHGHAIALILFDIDRLSDINRAHGYGVGDRILERMGILVRKYFRRPDWVARHAEDSIVVLLPETSAEDALALAERVRKMVEDRLTFRDHRTEKRVRVTVSAAVVTAAVVSSRPGEAGHIDAERVLAEAEAAVARAKKAGRNRTEHVEVLPAWFSVNDAARYLGCSSAEVRRLVAKGTLPAQRRARRLRVERAAVEAYRASHPRLLVPGP